jgi:hypothetical protein
VESERKRVVEAQQVIAIEQALGMMSVLVDVVRRHVRDDATLRIISNEFARLTQGERDSMAPTDDDIPDAVVVPATPA